MLHLAMGKGGNVVVPDEGIILDWRLGGSYDFGQPGLPFCNTARSVLVTSSKVPLSPLGHCRFFGKDAERYAARIGPAAVSNFATEN